MQTTDIFLWHDGYHCAMETKDNKKPIPLAYIITCSTYATGLHGDKRKIGVVALAPTSIRYS